MKKSFLFGFMFLLCTGVVAFAANKVESPKSCKQCGMDRVSFAYSRMMIVYADGTTAGTCSLNCAAVEMKGNKGKKVKTLRVADYTTKKLIDAKSAVWVIGGSKEGVMTSIPKWAFVTKSEAERFVKGNGGRIADFNEALNLALRENE